MYIFWVKLSIQMFYVMSGFIEVLSFQIHHLISLNVINKFSVDYFLS